MEENGMEENGMDWYIAIVDDLQRDREALAAALRERLGSELSVKCFADAEALLMDFSPGMYQLVFLDVCMDGMDGVELAKRLRAVDDALMIVFLTTSPEYIFDAVSFHPFDYILKPCQPDKLDHVLSEAHRILCRAEPELAVRVNRTDVRVPYSKLVAVSVRERTVEVRTASGQVLAVSASFAEVEQALSADPRFLPCFRGVLLNMEYIASIGKDSIRMLGGAEYPMRVRERKELLERFSQYQISGLRRRMN